MSCFQDFIWRRRGKVLALYNPLRNFKTTKTRSLPYSWKFLKWKLTQRFESPKFFWLIEGVSKFVEMGKYLLLKLFSFFIMQIWDYFVLFESKKKGYMFRKSVKKEKNLSFLGKMPKSLSKILSHTRFTDLQEFQTCYFFKKRP